MAKFIHSYRTISAKGHHGIGNTTIQNMWCFALSCLYVVKNSSQINLHTDKLGAKIFSHLPYNMVYEDCNDIAVHSKFFASCKMIALRREPLGSVHIDGDVFLKNNPLCEIFTNFKGDVVVQNREFIYSNAKIKDNYTQFFEGITEKIGLIEDFDLREYAFNAGVLGFKSAVARDMFCDKYFELAEKLTASDFDFDKVRGIDIMLEQANLFNLISKYHFSFDTVFQGCNTFSEEVKAEGARIGYTHLIGASKYDKKIQRQVKRAIFRLDKRVFFGCVIKAVWLRFYLLFSKIF